MGSGLPQVDFGSSHQSVDVSEGFVSQMRSPSDAQSAGAWHPSNVW